MDTIDVRLILPVEQPDEKGQLFALDTKVPSVAVGQALCLGGDIPSVHAGNTLYDLTEKRLIVEYGEVSRCAHGDEHQCRIDALAKLGFKPYPYETKPKG